MDLVKNHGSDDDRFTTFVDCPEGGCIYTLESGELMRYPRLGDLAKAIGVAVDGSACSQDELMLALRAEVLLEARWGAPPQEAVVYVPALGHPATADITPGSGIVGEPGRGAEDVAIFHNPDAIAGALERFADRVHFAFCLFSGRDPSLVSPTPTLATRVVPPGALVTVGTYARMARVVELAAPQSGQQVAAWLGCEQLDLTELQQSE